MNCARARMEDSKQRWRLLTLRLRVWDGDEKSACFFATGVRPPLAEADAAAARASDALASARADAEKAASRAAEELARARSEVDEVTRRAADELLAARADADAAARRAADELAAAVASHATIPQ